MQEVAFLHFSIEVLVEGSRVLGGADVVRKVDAVDDGAGVHYVEAVAEHPSILRCCPSWSWIICWKRIPIFNG
jgi:hypothetical protein